MGDADIARLIPGIQSADPEIRRAALDTLLSTNWHLRTDWELRDFPKLISPLVDALGSGLLQRTAIFKALKLFRQDDIKKHPCLAPLLVDALSDPEPEVRQNAAYFLGQLGPVSEAVVPALARALADEAVWVVVSAAQSLWQFGSAAASAVPALILLLESGREHVERK